MSLFSFPEIDTSVSVWFSLDGEEYEVNQFKIGFHQPVDPNKNQPEGEVRGGRLMVTLTQAVKSNIYGWGIKPWVKKDGAVLFKTGTSGVIFEVKFTNAYCISLSRTIHPGAGLATTLLISSETITMNGIKFENNWVK